MPFSSFFASNKPFNAPFAGLFEQWVVSGLIAALPPPGDAHNFIINRATCIVQYSQHRQANSPCSRIISSIHHQFRYQRRVALSSYSSCKKLGLETSFQSMDSSGRFLLSIEYLFDVRPTRTTFTRLLLL